MGNNDTAGCCSSGSRVCFNDKKIVLGGQSLLRKHPFRYRLRRTSSALQRSRHTPNICSHKHTLHTKDFRSLQSSLGEKLTSYHVCIFILASLFIFFFASVPVCVCVEVRLVEMWKPLEVSQLERRGGGENREVLPFSFIIL